MSASKLNHPARDLSRRERQIMNVLFKHGPSTAAQVMDRLPDGPGYSAVRAMLRILEEKGHINHEKVGPRYVYQSVTPKDEAGEQALRHTLSTFFKGSVSDAVAALLDDSETHLREDDLDRLEKLIEAHRTNGKSS